MLPDCRVTRRQFVGAGATSLAVAAVPVRLCAHLPAPYRALYDERFEVGRQFADEALRRGWIPRAIRGDVTQVWFHELALRWKRGPAPIAGVTTPASLFVLERLSWDVGMRVTVRDSAGQLVRWQIGLPDQRRSA